MWLAIGKNETALRRNADRWVAMGEAEEVGVYGNVRLVHVVGR